MVLDCSAAQFQPTLRSARCARQRNLLRDDGKGVVRRFFNHSFSDGRTYKGFWEDAKVGSIETFNSLFVALWIR